MAVTSAGAAMRADTGVDAAVDRSSRRCINLRVYRYKIDVVTSVVASAQASTCVWTRGPLTSVLSVVAAGRWPVGADEPWKAVRSPEAALVVDGP